MTVPTVSKELRSRYHSARLEWELVQRLVSEEIMSQSPFKKNDVVRDKDTGARYRVDGGNGYLRDGDVSYTYLRGYRVYKTGRREARAQTTLSPFNLELVTD